MRMIYSLITIFLLTMFATSTFAIDVRNVREQRTIVIDGITEQWRLEWLSSPTTYCGPENADWSTCPCSGFAFGEAGDLVLVRERPGKTPEQLRLKDFFKDGGASGIELPVLRRWDTKDSDYADMEKPGFTERLRQRPLAKVMELADYDSDGRATEFFIQTGTMPCGKRAGIVVGISRNNPRLHLFTTAKNPQQPLVLYDHQWKSLRHAKGHSVRVIDWPCLDHGSETEMELELKAVMGKISMKRRTYQCTESGKRGKLMEVMEESRGQQ